MKFKKQYSMEREIHKSVEGNRAIIQKELINLLVNPKAYSFEGLRAFG